MTSALPAAIASSQRHLPGLEFKRVRGNPERMALVYDVFKRLYKDPKTPLEKIELGTDRSCRLLYDNNSPKGLVVYKTLKSDDYRYNGSGDSIEIKVLILLDPKKDSGKGLCTQLLDKVLDFAGSVSARAVHVKLPPHERGLLRFYEAHDFKLIREHMRPGSDKVEECVLQRLLPQTIPVRQAAEKEVVQTPTQAVANSPIERPLTIGSYKPVTLKNPYVGLIQNGTKTVEGRINAGIFREVKEGDRFRFFNSSAEVFCRVTSVKSYTSFAAMLAAEGHKKCIPESSCFEAAAAAYSRIPGYDARARQSGVLALHLAVEPKPTAVVPAPTPPNLKRARE